MNPPREWEQMGLHGFLGTDQCSQVREMRAQERSLRRSAQWVRREPQVWHPEVVTCRRVSKRKNWPTAAWYWLPHKTRLRTGHGIWQHGGHQWPWQELLGWTKQHGRRRSRDFEIPQASGVLCEGEPRKLVMLDWCSWVNERKTRSSEHGGLFINGNFSTVSRVQGSRH